MWQRNGIMNEMRQPETAASGHCTDEKHKYTSRLANEWHCSQESKHNFIFISDSNSDQTQFSECTYLVPRTPMTASRDLD